MGSASTLKWAGPSVLLAYIIAGLFVFFIMRSMGEMLFLEPVAGSFAVYAHKYMNPYFGYLTAQGYWFMWIAVGISEITAIGVYVQFWFPEIPQWVPALIAVAMVALANPGGGAPVWGTGVLVRHDQSHHHHRDDSGGAGGYLLRLRQRR